MCQYNGWDKRAQSILEQCELKGDLPPAGEERDESYRCNCEYVVEDGLRNEKPSQYTSHRKAASNIVQEFTNNDRSIPSRAWMGQY